jgi:hypothetical protein
MRINILSCVLLFFLISCQSNSQESETDTDPPDSLSYSNNENYGFKADSSDIAIYERLIKYSGVKQLEYKTLPEIELEVATQFIGTPYVGHTLEKDSVENLVINLRELDCTTFMENVLAFSLCIKNKTTTFNDYCEMLVKMRYRNGEVYGYPSRLHYTTDWLMNNQAKGLIKIVSEDFGTSDFDSKVDFMSTHPQNYKQLVNNEYVEQMKQHELRISETKLKLIPKGKINETADKIKDGDIIAISTTVPGLDFSHVAIAAWKNDRLYFIHASSSAKTVIFSDKTLQDYLAAMKNCDGIIVGRLNQ